MGRREPEQDKAACAQAKDRSAEGAGRAVPTPLGPARWSTPRPEAAQLGAEPQTGRALAATAPAPDAQAVPPPSALPVPRARLSSRAACGLCLLPLLVGRQDGATDAPLTVPLAQAEDLSRSGLAFVELGAEPASVLVGQPFELRLRFGLQPEFLRASLVQLFRQSLDVPVQAFVPAWDEGQGLRFLAEEGERGTARFALGEAIRLARRAEPLTRDGHDYTVFELTRRAVATHAGELTLAAPVLAFAYATRFGDDFVQGRVPLDRREALVRGSPLRLDVAPPPEAGRPEGFSGAIGRCEVRASAEPQDLRLGQSLALVLAVEAREAWMDLSTCEPPVLGPLPDLRLAGTLVEREAHALRVRYDLVPTREGALEIPALAFTTFDPEPPAGYRRIETQPIPLVVRAAPDEPRAVSAPPAAAPAAPRKPALPLSVLLGGGLALLVFLVVLAWPRRSG